MQGALCLQAGHAQLQACERRTHGTEEACNPEHAISKSRTLSVALSQ